MSPLRAAIYCRCSTEEESQVDALKNQVFESVSCVETQGWFLAEQYVESKSGTTTKGRQEYNRLFEDLLFDKFDIIVIKSQDRLMRNVKDWYLFLDRMLTNKKRLYMYLEHKFYSADDALITGIKAILAEEYSRELSKKINNAHRNRQKNGGKAMLTSRVFGYEKQADGSVKIDESEAKIIRIIYEYCAAGYSSSVIAGMLSKQGYKKKTGVPVNAAFIGKMIHNPLYKGTFVMNRIHYDFETKQRIRLPESDWIYDTNTVPPVVSTDLWERANTAMAERGKRVSQSGGYIKGNSSGKYDLSGKILCGQCGSPYYRTWRKTYANPAEKVIEWKCRKYLEEGRKSSRESIDGCDNIHLNEQIVFALLEQVSTRYYKLQNENKENMINHAVKVFQKVLSERKSETESGQLEEIRLKTIHQKELLLTKLLEGVISDRDYKKRNENLEAKLMELDHLREEEKQKRREEMSREDRVSLIRTRLQDGGFQRAIVVELLSNIRQIIVHEWTVEIIFRTQGTPSVSVDYPFPAFTERGRYLDKIKIINMMKETPDVTAKIIAAAIDRPVKVVQNRIGELRREVCIRYNGSGGHGVWEVLNSEIHY